MPTNDDRWMLPLTASPVATDLVGAKAVGLTRLLAAELPVPEAFAVSTQAFQDAAGPALDAVETLLAGLDEADPRSFAAVCAQARRLVREATAGHPVLLRAVEAGQALVGASGGVAVRSSGVDEDGSASSHAGEHDTYLWVQGEGELAARVQDCWASLYTERAVSYRRRLGRPASAMGVVVQRMVDADAAGVMMTLNPSTGDRSVVAVESVWGLGETLVSGSVTPDRFLVNKVTGELMRRELAAKPHRLARGPDGRTQLEPVAAEFVERASLEPRHLTLLHAWVERLERCVGGPADVEFAVDHDQVWLLQARPETFWANQPRKRPLARGTALDAILTTLRPGMSSGPPIDDIQPAHEAASDVTAGEWAVSSSNQGPA